MSQSSGVDGYSSPVKSNSAQPAQTPPQGSRSRDKSVKTEVKSEPKSEISSIHQVKRGVKNKS